MSRRFFGCCVLAQNGCGKSAVCLVKGECRFNIQVNQCVGWQDKDGMYRNMAAADVAVFPAAQSVIWQQCIGMGLPLILCERSEITGMHPQTVDYMNRHDNIIVMDWEPSLAPQIREHLERLKRDPEELRRRSAGATLTAEEYLDWERVVDTTLKHLAA